MSEQQENIDIESIFYSTEESEPVEKPTEEIVDEEEPAEEEKTPEEADDTESDEETEEQDDAQTVLIDDEEHNITDVQEWKQSHDAIKSMQADCTKKWQEASELKKESEAKSQKLDGMILELEVLVSEDEETNLNSFKDPGSENYDPERFIELKEKFDKRKAKLAELKTNQPQQSQLSKDELAAESSDFLAYDPKWLKDGATTKAYQDDMKLVQDYLQKSGYSQEEVNGLQRSHFWKTIVDAARYQKATKKASSIKSPKPKAPKVTKPKVNKSTPKSAEEVFYGG